MTQQPSTSSTSSNNGAPSANRIIDDCFRRDPLDQTRLSHGEAVAALKARIAPIAARGHVRLGDACGRILAQDVRATLSVPGHTNSAVDGYAFAFSDYDISSVQTGDPPHGELIGHTFPIAGRATAGHGPAGIIAPGAAVRIFTGAVVPDGLDTVAMQEDCALSPDGHVIIPDGLRGGANVRCAGEDVAQGDVLVQAGERLRPQDIAALASSGGADVSCFKPIRVGIASTGDEVVVADGTRDISSGQVFDVNSPMLAGFIRQTGASVVDLGIWPDRRDETEQRLLDAAQSCDVVLTTGGASQGEEDHIAHGLAARGNRHFWQIAVKPGRPLMFGQVGNTIVVGMPGNPVAVFVCFLLYVYPLIGRLGGANWFEPRRFPLPAAFSIDDRKLGRREFLRGISVQTPNGLVVEKFPRDGSGLISGLRAADGLIEIPEDRPSVVAGELVDFIPFSQFGVVE